MSSHLHQQGALGELLVEPGGPQGDGPGQAGPKGVHLLLDLHGQGQMLPPVREGGPRVIGAHQQHHLGGFDAVDLKHRLIHRAVGAHQGVPVDVQHHLNGGILGQMGLDPRPGLVIGVVIGGVIVQFPVVNDV